MNIKHEILKCPNCKKKFECKANNIINCFCNNIIISKKTKDFISNNFDGCLCKECLEELNAQKIY